MLDPQEIILELPNFQYGRGTLDENWFPLTISDNNLFPIVPFIYGPYLPRAEIFPRLSVSVANGGVATGLTARQQIEDAIRLPARSFLVGFSTVSPQAAGFQFSIFDVGRNDFAFTQKWQSSLCIPQKSKPYFLVLPYPIVDAGAGWGKLNIRMVNSATVSNDCQLAIWFCVPAGSVRQIQDLGNSRTVPTGKGLW